jgi:hypothetical protein
MASLEQGLERLERALGAQEPPGIMVTLVDSVSVPPAPIKGWRDHKGFDCGRLPGETEEELAERAQAEAKVTALPSECGVVALCSYDDLTE